MGGTVEERDGKCLPHVARRERRRRARQDDVDQVLDATACASTSVGPRVGMHLLGDVQRERECRDGDRVDTGEAECVGTVQQFGGRGGRPAEADVDERVLEGATREAGRDVVADGGAIECGGERIRAGKYIIATGGSPAVPPIPGLKEAGYLTSTTALELREPPKRLAVLGGGPVGLEMGQLFMRLGSAVTFITRREVASREEPETSQTLQAVLEEEGARVVTNADVTGVERVAGGRRLSFKHDGRQEVLDVDEVLVATGRRPNTEGMGLEKAGIELTKLGAIKVGDDLQTTNPRVWAAGDVTGHRQLVYVAAYEGNMAVRNALEAAGRKVDFHSLPRVIFTSPTFAAAGLTDEEANARGFKCECRVLPMSAVPRALVNRDTRGFMKIVAEAGTGKILGASMVADGAGDVIHSAVLAIQFGLTIDDVANTWAPYLTFAEAFKLAAQSFKRDVSKLSCCAA